MDTKPQTSAFLRGLFSLNTFLMTGIPPGPKCLQIRHSINLHKGFASITYFFMLQYYGFNWNGTDLKSLRAVLLLIIHGIYGILWLYKDIHFPDYAWRQPATIGSFLFIFMVINLLYYAPMYFLLSDAYPHLAWFQGLGSIYVALISYIFGVFLHFTADCQKFFQLKYQRPRKLITDGLFAYSRSPNYLGEVLIYLGFSLMSGHLIPLMCSAAIWLTLFVPNIYTKDASVSRYPEYKAWTQRSRLFFVSLPAMLGDLQYIFVEKPECKSE